MNITRALVKRGYSDTDIEKLIGGNTLRLVEQVVG
jgi:microsomal dipeptidase-like Zn-dependent dipeptidase